MAVSAKSTYAAAREAIKGFRKTGPGSTFIMTGNKPNTGALPGVLCFGMGRFGCGAYDPERQCFIQEHGLQKPTGWLRFYYVDQRQPDGGPTIPVDGAAHARLYLDLVNDPEPRQWDYTFVDGQGYVIST
ncbi:short-chain dehydrogenase [Apiospora marii]|uniref:Short-chain dehydrogenase n=1 Tax=Apiospora marii TaxID=335849 RepID=A0ABR1RB47_9PEZI